MNTIAIIDDDLHIGDMLTDVLSKEGYRVLWACSGTEALALLSHENPNLVLLDLMLPGAVPILPSGNHDECDYRLYLFCHHDPFRK